MSDNTLAANANLKPFDQTTFRRRGLMVVGAIVAVCAGMGIWVGTENSQPHFTVGAGGNLVSHLGYKRSINLADRYHLPINMYYQGHYFGRISPAAAQSLGHSTQWFRIAPLVYAGDEVDMRWGSHFRPEPNKKLPEFR
jgi:hypothetical protein